MLVNANGYMNKGHLTIVIDCQQVYETYSLVIIPRANLTYSNWITGRMRAAGFDSGMPRDEDLRKEEFSCLLTSHQQQCQLRCYTCESVKAKMFPAKSKNFFQDLPVAVSRADSAPR